MVINNSPTQKEIPKELVREVKILYELGVKDYEIEYIIYLKTKQEIRKIKNYPGQPIKEEQMFLDI